MQRRRAAVFGPPGLHPTGRSSPTRSAVGRLCRAVLPLIAGLVLSAGHAAAQQAIVGPQDAVVTGFSGIAPGTPPAGSDPLDYLVIPPDGPSARVIDLSTLGAQGTLTNARKPFTVTAGQVGQVFGVTLDDAQAPSIYLAASSAYGVSIGLTDASTGAVKRLRHGLAGAAFIPGMFGPAQMGGGPASIWKVDGSTGQVALFANVGAPGANVAAGLGGLAYDPNSQQIFVADRATGLIHRLGLDGTDRGTYDHGVDGRRAGGQSDAAFQPVTVDLTSSAFDTEQPASWGNDVPERLVFALAVRNGRLYYSVAAGPEIWSVGIAQDGSFGTDPRFEVAVQPLQPNVEVSSITFDSRGLLYAAERAPATGAYDFRNVAQGGSERVLRFRAKSQLDSNPGLWLPVPEEYAIGMAGQFRNADGGVALGRGYDRSGRIQTGTCGVTLWSTGEKLLGDGPSTDPIDGIQGNDTQLVLPSNSPPQQSWFIDYDDRPGDPQASGLMGAIVTLPCAPAQRATIVPFVPPVRPPVLINCPYGTSLIGGVCMLPPSCPPGTNFRDGYCVAFGCPPDMIRRDGRCVPPPQRCDRYETYIDGRCIPWSCPPDMVRQSNGYCGCPRDTYYDRGECRPARCPPGLFPGRDGQCYCPPDLYLRDGRCVPPPPPQCPPGMRPGNNGQCYCPPDLFFRDGRCLPPPPQCPPGMRPGDNGQCYCPPDLIFRDGRCVPPPHRCPPGLIPGPNDQCQCPQDLILRDGKCVPPPRRCQPPLVAGPNDQCQCPQDLILRDGKCVPPPRRCQPPLVPGPNDQCQCPQDQVLRDGKCVPPPRPCPNNGVRGNDGNCQPPIQQPCPNGQPKDRRGNCLPPPRNCPNNGVRDNDGNCQPPIQQLCPGGQPKDRRGNCLPLPTQCPDGQIRDRNNRCVFPTKLCPNGQPQINGKCAPVIQDCQPGEIRLRGRCVPNRIQDPVKIKPDLPIKPIEPVRPIKPIEPLRPIKPDRPIKIEPERTIKPDRIRPIEPRNEPKIERQIEPSNRQPNFVKPQFIKPEQGRPQLEKQERQFNPKRGGGGCKPGQVFENGECRAR